MTVWNRYRYSTPCPAGVGTAAQAFLQPFDWPSPITDLSHHVSKTIIQISASSTSPGFPYHAERCTRRAIPWGKLWGLLCVDCAACALPPASQHHRHPPYSPTELAGVSVQPTPTNFFCVYFVFLLPPDLAAGLEAGSMARTHMAPRTAGTMACNAENMLHVKVVFVLGCCVAANHLLIFSLVRCDDEGTQDRE